MACDDGNSIDNDGCTNACGLPILCPNGNPDLGEECDGGDADDTNGCLSNCWLARCGDGHTNPNTLPPEECDDAGESVDCDADCTRRTCCDGTVNTTAGEACDVGTVVPNGQCTLDCDVVCETDYGDCTDAPGCETKLLSDGNNCGRCGHDCGGGACGLGVCQPVEIAELGTMHDLKLEGMQIYQDRVWNETDAGLASVPLDARGLTTPVVYPSVVPTMRGYSFVDSDIWFFSNLKLYSAPMADTGATPALLSDTVQWGPAMQVYGDSLYVLTSYDSPTKPRVVRAPLADPNSYTTADLSFQGVPLYGVLVTGGEVYFASAGATSGELWRVMPRTYIGPTAPPTPSAARTSPR